MLELVSLFVETDEGWEIKWIYYKTIRLEKIKYFLVDKFAHKWW